MSSQEATSTGAFEFALNASTRDGTYQYRVVKARTSGRAEAASAPVTVAVGRATSLTLTAHHRVARAHR